MIKKSFYLVILSMVIISFSATASKPYIGVNGELFVYDEPDLDDSYTSTSLTFRAGFLFNDFFGVEGRYGHGLGKSTGTEVIEALEFDLKVGVENYVSALLVGRLPFNDHFNASARVGFSSVNRGIEISRGSFSASDEESANTLSWFLAAEFTPTPDYGLSLELGSLYNRDSITVAGFGVGFTRYF